MIPLSGGNKLLDVNVILSKAKIGPKMKIADLGCGTTGHFVFPAAKMVGKEGIVYAVDILKTVLESIDRRARVDNFTNVKTIWSDLEIFNATNIESGSLDLVLIMNTLHLSQKRAEVLREARRLLKKKGKLVIVEWKNTVSPFGPPPEVRVNYDNLIIAAERMGLKLEEEFFAGHYHFGLIFIKI